MDKKDKEVVKQYTSKEWIELHINDIDNLIKERNEKHKESINRLIIAKKNFKKCLADIKEK